MMHVFSVFYHIESDDEPVQFTTLLALMRDQPKRHPFP